MCKLLFSLFDKKSCTYGNVFGELSQGAAVRMVSDMVREGRALFAIHPEDFQLCQVGSFDECTGALNAVDVAVVVELLSLVEKPSEKGDSEA